MANAAAFKKKGDDCFDAGDLRGAETNYGQAIAADPGNAAAYNNLGLVLMQQRRFDEAESSVKKAVELNPRLFDAFYILGMIAHEQGKLREAVGYLINATEIKSDFSEAFNYAGNLLLELGDRTQAEAAYRSAVSTNPNNAQSLYNLAGVIQEQGRRGEAIGYYRRALALSPTFNTARLNMVHQLQQLCDWQDIDSNTALVRQYVREAPFDQDGRDSPFAFLALPGTTAYEQKMCAERWTKGSYRLLAVQGAQLGFRYDWPANPRIKIGYLSADFHMHATAVLMAEIFELHDKQRFHVTAYSYGPDDQSEMRSRLQGAFDEFVHVGNESLVDTAKRIHADHIDILVDLKGYTGDTRSGILALRPAPVQVNYLGYPGTMGADFVDYLIADRFIIPNDSRQFYTEKVMYLPDSYQPNDRTRPRPDAPSRSSQQLPAGEMVFCCFNQTYKISPGMFDVWCKLLDAVPGSVLWLLSNTSVVEENLKQEASKRGVDSGRLIFAPRVKMDEHLARLQCADLFLDTIPYNAHTTCSEALWMGLPVVTCAGESFASRVAGSLLTTLGVPELVTYTLEEYFALALELATDAEKRAGIRQKINAGRSASPLFDSEKFTRNLEAVYDAMLVDHKESKGYFQIVIVSPANYAHSQAFEEVAQTLQHGLSRLAIHATISRNAYSRNGRNIILGSNLLTPDEIAWIPAGSIIYNLEQIYQGSPWLTPNLIEILGKFEIWDYSPRNVETIRALVPGSRVKYVPVGYVKELTRIQAAQQEDIDVLFYGSVNERRQNILNELASRGVKVKAVFGVYGEERDALIGRAKLILNMRLYESDIFEIVRVSYLLANQKTVVSECSDSTDIEPDMRNAVALTPYSRIADTCLELLKDAEKRRSIAEQGFKIMAARPEEAYLRSALDLPLNS
ncbi:O-linked N-acetylglucosamine transferase, SPINDLY family protein [Undibacterium terreum]|uniref:protein O-GlcNAc transferase n=1 Tax=Undibacterium terreum TaxID=1224302 RepID=A0A916XMC2_9BURK|nr:tetratricopeptide repeat protein [Undibacterium terreum]GGC83915.1 hypothetical protein GCM10011396_34110 [Undibacterium terreum]